MLLSGYHVPCLFVCSLMATSQAHLPILYMTQIPPPHYDELFPPQYTTFCILQWQWHSCPTIITSPKSVILDTPPPTQVIARHH